LVEARFRIARNLVTRCEDAVVNAMMTERCRFYETMRGDVIDLNASSGAAHARGFGDTRYLWFGLSALAPIH
jgi:hypothetical protein